MTDSIEALTTPVMVDALRDRGVSDVNVEVFDTLPSTSEYLSAVIKKAGSQATTNSQESTRGRSLQPRLCVADWQTSGNGRRGKSWVTERGNITFSMSLALQKPPAQLLGLSLVTGICVAESLAALADVSVNLKWPNDVLVGDRKLCGLLTELVSGTGRDTRVVVGIGINYTLPAEQVVSDYQAASLPMLVTSPPTRAALISDICARLLNEYAVFEAEGWAAFVTRWDSFDYLQGREVRVLTAQGEERAKAVGVDKQGALLVEADGVIRAVYSGDVSLRLAKNEPNSQR